MISGTDHLALHKIYEGTVESVAFGGEGIIRHNNFVVFVPYTVPGDRIQFRITELKRSFARGKIERILNPSSFRVTPPCPIYFTCGGCQHQEFEYLKSVEEKSRILEGLLRHGLKLEKIPMEPPIPSPLSYGYRHKMQVAVGESSDGKLLIGLYETLSHRIVDMQTCPIQHPVNNQLLDAFRKAIPSLGWRPYHENSNIGLIRHFLGRVNQKGEAFAVIIATQKALPYWESLREALSKTVPELQGLAVNVNPMRTNVVLGTQTHLLWGKSFLEESVGKFSFKFGPTSFFQVNPLLLPKVTDKIIEWLAPSKNDKVLDLYCGVGTFSLPLAEHADEVVGIEENSESIEWAKENAKANRIKNVKFIVGRAEDRFQNAPSLVLLDPPRSGLHPAVLEKLLKLKPKRIAYLSCNPSTLTRDLGVLLKGGWKLSRATAVDFFPQTSHIEALALLET